MKIGYEALEAFQEPGEAGNFCRHLISGMMKAHPEQEYAFLEHGPGLELPFFFRALNESGARWNRFRAGFPGKIGRKWGWGPVWKKQQADVVHFLHPTLPLDWKPGSIRTVVQVHDLLYKHFPSSFSGSNRWWKEKIMKGIASKADVIVFPSESLKTEFEAAFPLSVGKTKVLYRDADPGFSYRKRPEAVAKVLYKYNLVERPYMLAYGKLDTWKDRDRLIRVFESVMNEIPEDLVLVGARGNTGEAITDQLSRFGGRLRWLGEVDGDELVNLYDGCSFVVESSQYEGFPLGIFQGMKREKAVICPDLPVFSEVGGQTVRLFEMDKDDGLARAMKEISLDEALKNRFAFAGHQRVAGISQAKYLEAVFSLYQPS